jgi:hypothetical protein
VETLKQAENSSSQEDHNNHQHVKAKFPRAKLKSRRRSWVKQLNDQGTGGNTKIALKNNVDILMGKQAANCLADFYAED